MMHHALALSAAILLASLPTRADQPVSPAEFAEFATGWTLYYEEDGEPMGSETFRPDGRVRWRDADGVCADGVWRAYGDQMCFYYGPGTPVQCWALSRTQPDGPIRLTLTGDGEDAGLALDVAGRDRQPLTCKGEGVGS